MKGQVLITRPEPGAGITAARLKLLGFTPVILPLTKIAHLEQQFFPDPETVDAIVVTSVNGVRHVINGALQGFISKPVYAVGDASAEAVREAGFRYVYSASGDARNLADLIIRHMPEKSRLLHLAGVDRTAGFEDALKAQNIDLTIVETYKAQKISYSTDFLNSLFREKEIVAAPIFSPRAARLLVELIEQSKLGELFKKTMFFCISENAATPLSRLFVSQIKVSREPTEESVITLLSS